MKLLRDAGVPADRLIEVAEAIERDFSKAPRSKGAERQARWREKQKEKGKDDTQSVTRDVSGDETETQQVTSSLQLPVQREYLPSVEFDYGLSNASTRDERERAARDLRNRTPELVQAIKQRVNGSADWTRYQMNDLSTLIRLMAPTAGEPVLWVEDLLPAIDTAVAQHKQKGKPLTTWNYVVPIALRNRDDRLKPLPEPEKSNGRHERSSLAGRGEAYRGRGPAEDILDRALADLDGRSARSDIIEHTGPTRARAAAGGV
jgi:hypothetical protein